MHILWRIMSDKLHQGRVSRADVAKLADVAPCTVSLVLNNTPNRIKEETRQRIRDAAQQLGYKPSATARALVTGRMDSLGVVIFQGGSPFDPYTSGILTSFWHRIRQDKYRLSFDSIELDESAAGYFIDHAADGIMLIAPPGQVEGLEMMQKAGFPLVCVGNHPETSAVDYIDIDNYSAGRQATELLLEHGHKKIIHIAGIPDKSSTAAERFAGYRDAIQDAGLVLDPQYIFSGDFIYETGKAAILDALEKGVDFTAVFAATSDTAYGAIDELETHGFDVPNDISVVEIKTLTNVVGKRCQVTGIINPLEQIGKVAGEILLQRINGAKTPAVQRLIRGELFTGNTLKRIN